MKNWRIGVVGLGAAAKNIHIPALRKLPFATIAGGFDPNCSADGVPQLPSLAALLELQLDLVVIATPPASHLPIVRACFEAGIDVFCEKPLANSVVEADEMLSLASRYGRQLVVNSEFPFMNIHRAAEQMIGTPEFGKLRFLDIQQWFHMNAETEAGWRGADPQRTFKEFGTHVLDMAISFFGERPLRYESVMPGYRKGVSADYLSLIRLEFSDERYAQITLDRLTRGRHRYLETRLVGEHATIEASFGGRASVAAGIRPQDRKPFLRFDVAGGGIARIFTGERMKTIAREPFDPFADATARLLQEAMHAIAAGEPAPNRLSEARETLALLYGCYDQAEERRPR